jgi:PhnB protein
MVSNPPDGMPRVSPIILYEDAAAALDWLVKAFGFSEVFRMKGEGDVVVHAEISLADGIVMLGCPGPDYKSPKSTGQVTVMIYVYVDDVDAHYEVAKAAGAEILSTPEDQFYGDRSYRVKDLEGHEWGFGTHIKDVAPEDMHP